MKNVVSYVSATPSSGSANGAAIDVSKMAGKLYIGVASALTGGTSPAVSATKIQTCDTDSGTFVDVAAFGTDGDTIIVDQRDCKEYIRAVLTVTGSPTAAVIATAAAGEVKAR